MALDVQAAVMWLTARSDVRTGAIALVGASFGATAALLAAGELPAVKAVALVSPAADYRGVRLDPGLPQVRRAPAAAGRQHRGSLRPAHRAGPDRARRRRRGRSGCRRCMPTGRSCIDRDPELAASLVDWLRQTLLF